MGNFKEIDVILILPSNLQKLEDVYWSPRPNCLKVTSPKMAKFEPVFHGSPAVHEPMMATTPHRVTHSHEDDASQSRSYLASAFSGSAGKDPNSFHRIVERSYEDLKNQSQHIQNVFENFTSEQIANNRLQLKASIEVVRMLAFQGIAFRGRDESVDSTNCGNFLEILNLIVSYNEQIAEVIAKAPKNASYTSPMIQKEILHIFSTKVKETIRKEIGNAKFCIIVDKARDESMKEQMAIVLRFVEKDAFLAIENIRGQGYDGASNMRVAASKEVIPVHQFFTNLTSIVNIVCALCSRFEELRIAQTAEIAYLIEIDEIQSGRGFNQISNLQRAGNTRWSSHLRSVSSLIKIFSPACEVLLKIIDVGTSSSQRAEADSVYQVMTSFEFVFILHLMKETMQITDHNMSRIAIKIS
ncbi:uncharacterized protein LOC133881145 [Alnus glutinosa]|uniref:uncharacterized protein LOC133881145 n=1 Tax=Alnus glutinosa TaxID=3517 RepID=UPI002D787C4A|nr:uncharacterized protein LOC133881145 [Alnus glutinosa]